MLAGVSLHVTLLLESCLFMPVFCNSHMNRGREERRGKLLGFFYLEHLIEVLTEVLDKVHVREAGQDQVSGLLGEGHLSLGEPCPVERV